MMCQANTQPATTTTTTSCGNKRKNNPLSHSSPNRSFKRGRTQQRLQEEDDNNNNKKDLFHLLTEKGFLFQTAMLHGQVQSTESWKDKRINHDVGFIVNHRVDDKITSLSHFVTILSDIFNNNNNNDEQTKGLLDFLLHQKDSFLDIQSAINLHKKMCMDDESRLVGDDDLQYWAITMDSNPNLGQQLAFFFRCTRPLCFRRIQSHISSSSNDGSQPIIFESANFSLLDVMFQIPSLQTTIVEAILLQILRLESTLQHLQHYLVQLLQKYLTTINNQQSSLYLHETCTFLNQCFPHVAHVVQFDQQLLTTTTPTTPTTTTINNVGERQAMWYANMTVREVQQQQQQQYGGARRRRRIQKRSCPQDCQLFQKQLRIARRKMLREYRRAKRVENTRLILGARPENDDLLFVKEKDMSLDEFIAKIKVMNRVNATFPRPYFPGISRPKLQQIILEDSQLQSIKDLFFDADGSLKDSIRQDIDNSAKHGYINFSNANCREERHDKRWQVPILKHTSSSLIPTRQAVEKILSSIYDSELEIMCDLGILIGGTEDQSLHHDTARQIVKWIPENPEKMHPVPGWEIDRLAYNEVMSSPIAPSSILIGVTDQDGCLVGVQKDHIIRIESNDNDDNDDDKNWCRISGGTGEAFEIVRETDCLVVLKSKMGVMFTGDFPHAGVRNVSRGTLQDRLMDKLYRQIDSVLEQHVDDYDAQANAIIDILCNFPGLNRLCRLHCSTEVKRGGPQVPANTIGFTGCLPNPPDPRCLEHDNDCNNNKQQQQSTKSISNHFLESTTSGEQDDSDDDDSEGEFEFDDDTDDSSNYEPGDDGQQDIYLR